MAAMKEELVEHLRRDPFVPFRIMLTSGQGYDVTDPQLVALGESLIHVMFPQSDRYAILRLNQIASMELLETVK
jgi:hypothetical protein